MPCRRGATHTFPPFPGLGAACSLCHQQYRLLDLSPLTNSPTGIKFLSNSHCRVATAVGEHGETIKGAVTIEVAGCPKYLGVWGPRDHGAWATTYPPLGNIEAPSLCQRKLYHETTISPPRLDANSNHHHTAVPLCFELAGKLVALRLQLTTNHFCESLAPFVFQPPNSKMRPRTICRFPRWQHDQKPVRTFTYNSAAVVPGSRPRLPFLSTPSARHEVFRRQQWRYLTTERKQRLKEEAHTVFRWTAYLWAVLAILAIAGTSLQEDWIEEDCPTPHEWTFLTRLLKRSSEAQKLRTDVVMPDWVLIVQLTSDVLKRLESEDYDGKGVKDLGPESPPGAKDISAMSEAWRRGYYETLLLCCEASQFTEGWVLDTTRKTVFPPEVVRGPSNPNPKPIPLGSKSPPREENCVPAGFPPPNDCYLKLIGTKGLTNKQRMDASLAYANWLENNGAVGPAAIVYEDALQMAVGELPTSPDSPPLLDPKTMTLNDKAGRLPSANLITTLTAVATFKARHGDVSAALPILISILQARRSLPSQPPPDLDAETKAFEEDTKTTLEKAFGFVREHRYPPPPPDGTAPPVRDSKQRCEEAALHLHIGEIMFAMQPSTREQGWAWTREGVDLAEEQLHKVLEAPPRVEEDAKKLCRQCLTSGLGNWATMVKQMARAEEAAKANGDTAESTAGWFGLWSSGTAEENIGRWTAEEKLCEERTRRAQVILENPIEPPSNILHRWVKA